VRLIRPGKSHYHAALNARIHVSNVYSTTCRAKDGMKVMKSSIRRGSELQLAKKDLTGIELKTTGGMKTTETIL
jgi:hypothetical protein